MKNRFLVALVTLALAITGCSSWAGGTAAGASSTTGGLVTGAPAAAFSPRVLSPLGLDT